jgi:hypothetical protein
MDESGVPAWLVGIWRRESIELSGAPDLPSGPFETAAVVWFQSRTRYADLRIPRGGPAPFSEEEAFGGRQHWNAPRLRFAHELDRSDRLADDEGDLELRHEAGGEVLLEAGTFVHGGRSCRYVERWRRATPPDPVLEVHELRGADGDLDGLSLRIHDEALLLRCREGLVCARHERADDAGRTTIAALGDPGPAPGTGPGAIGGTPHTPWRRIEAPA